MTTSTRRRFLQSTLAASLALEAGPAPAIEPIQRHGRSHLRLSMAGYSYRKYLALNLKPKPPMNYDDFIDTAADLNIDAVELTAYYFPETTPSYLAHLKGRCSRLGLDVSGTAVGNNFCTADPARLAKEIESVKRWVEHTSRLGGKTIRIFAGNLDRGDTEEAARQRCVEAIQQACDYAGKYGIILALENHGGITATIDQTLELVRAIKHPWFGVNWDTGNFHSPDPYADLARLAPYAVTVQIKTEIVRTGRNRTEGEGRGGKKEEADLKRLLDLLRSVGYRGYIALEYEADEDPRTGVPRAIGALRPLMG